MQINAEKEIAEERLKVWTCLYLTRDANFYYQRSEDLRVATEREVLELRNNMSNRRIAEDDV